jgi:hypothetical protein
MKAKKRSPKVFTPISAIAAGFALTATGAQAQTTPVFEYDFPASGAGPTITDQSSAGNNGSSDGTISLDAVAPPGAAGGTQSLNTTAGGVLTDNATSLANSAVAAAGGFTYNVSFMWNGTDSSSFGHTEKIIDYAGTESLQLITSAGSASLQMSFGDDVGNESIPVSTTIAPNTWYNVSLTFNTGTNTVDINGDISGIASMVVNGGVPIAAAATKGTYGDSLARPIGVGQLGAPFGYLVGFKGDIYNPSVSLGVVPAPAAPYFLAPAAQSGSVNLSLISAPGFTYQIQANTNLMLTNWTALTNIVSTNGTIQFSDTNASNFLRRYYRAVYTN